MALIRFSTTGTQDPVVFKELGGRTFNHPTIDEVLVAEVGDSPYTLEEVKGAQDIVDLLDAGHITIKDANGNVTTTSTGLAKISNTTILNDDGTIDFTPVDSLTDVEGKVGYLSGDKALSLKTDIPGSTQSLGQEFWIRVINKTGVSIPDGSLVYISGFDITSGRPTITLAKADVEATSNTVGFTTNIMADNAEGFVTAIGFLNDLDTSTFFAGEEIFLSDTVAGGITATKPLNAVPVGFITKVDVSTGQILTTIARKIVDSPLFAQLSDSTAQKPSVTTPIVVTFDTNDDIRGIAHSIISATEDIIINIPGEYTLFAQPQVERTSGAASEEFHMWVRIGTDDKGGVSSVSVANPSVITTDDPHGLVNGQTVEISDVTTTPDINGQHVITVTGASTYTIPVNVTAVTDGVGNWRRVLDVNDDVINSNVELQISGASAADVIPLIITQDLVKGDKINIMQSVSTTTNGMGLIAKTPSGEPAIPSMIFTLNRN